MTEIRRIVTVGPLRAGSVDQILRQDKTANRLEAEDAGDRECARMVGRGAANALKVRGVTMV